MASPANSEYTDFGFQIAPMVDVVFVLMLFFMAFAAMKVREKELPAKLPGSGFAVSPPIVIEVADDGSVSANNRVYGNGNDKALGNLRGWLHEIVTQFGTEGSVIIRPASEARHERIMEVLNAVAASGVQRVTFG